MKEEIAAAVFFIARLAKTHGCLDNECRDRFAAALTSVLFESYKKHWYPETPSKGQGYRCLRMNSLQLRDPVLEQACSRSAIGYEDLGLPQELTIWVDPGEVSCRYGERSAPFSVILLGGCHSGDGEFSRRIQNAVERASLEIQSGASSDEESGNTSMSSGCSSLSISSLVAKPEPKTIPTVSNPNSVYQISDFPPLAPPPWPVYPKRKVFSGYPPHPSPGNQSSQKGYKPSYRPGVDKYVAPTSPGSQFPPLQKGYKPYRPSFSFLGPRVDKYHWVSKTRS